MERRNILEGLRAFLPTLPLFGFCTAIAGLRALGQQQIRVGAVIPEISLWWLAFACAIAFFLRPPFVSLLRLGRLFVVTLAATVLAWWLSGWPQETSQEAPPKAVSVYHLPETGTETARNISTNSLNIKERRYLNRITGRRRQVALEISAYLMVPESGLHRFKAQCDDRCSLRIGNEKVLHGIRSAFAEISLEAGIHRFWLRYQQRGGPASMKLEWDRPALIELLPLDHYVGHQAGLLTAEARRASMLNSALWALLRTTWWFCAFCLLAWVGEKARRRWLLGSESDRIALRVRLGAIVKDLLSGGISDSPDEEPLRTGIRVTPAVLLLAAAVNLPFVLCHPDWMLIESPLLRSLAINSVLFLVPGLPFAVALFGSRKPGLWLLWGLAFSYGILLGVVTFFCLAGWPLTSGGAWNATWIVTNIGILTSVLSGRAATWDLSFDRRVWTVGGCLFVVAYYLYLFGAERVVPPQSDHDFEVQGTGYSLLTRLEPFLLTDRGTYYYFAHPLLLHYYVAGSFLYFNQLDHLAFYDAASLRAMASQRGEPFDHPMTLPTLGHRRILGVEGRDYVFSPPLENGKRRISVQRVELRGIYQHYADNPYRLATRTPTVFMAALTVALLGIWVLEIAPGWMAVLVGLAYATSPEVFVRSSYGGYFGISNFSLLLILLAMERWPGRRDAYSFATCFLAASMAALANHKLVLLPISIILCEVLRTIWEVWRKPELFRRKKLLRIPFHPVVLGFAFGTAVFWTYGTLINFEAFWAEHVRTHLADRLIHHNPLGYQGYPDPLQLWLEFWRHTGYALLPLGALALILGTREDLSRQTNRSSLDLWLIWSALTAIVFTLVDWRMTKHLMPLMLPLYLAPAQWATSGKGRLGLVAILFSAVLVWNCVTVHSLVVDFDAFHVSPEW